MLETTTDRNNEVPLPSDLGQGTLFDAATLEQLKGEQQRWEKTTVPPSVRRLPEREPLITTSSVPIKRQPKTACLTRNLPLLTKTRHFWLFPSGNKLLRVFGTRIFFGSHGKAGERKYLFGPRNHQGRFLVRQCSIFCGLRQKMSRNDEGRISRPQGALEQLYQTFRANTREAGGLPIAQGFPKRLRACTTKREVGWRGHLKTW